MIAVNDGNSTWSRTPVYRFNKGINRYNEYNDPTYLGFVFMFDYVNSPLFKSGVGGAVDYLNRTGETLRATYLDYFIKTLQSINIEMPWYWQSFEGAENLWKYDGFKDPYKGGDDSVLTISCLESIDLKMTMLIDLYRKAVYDQQYKRIILPENLRKFEMYIYVQELRKFQINKYLKLLNNVMSAADINSGQVSNSEIYKNENSPRILWLLKFCEFNPDVSALPFASLNNSVTEVAKQTISIKYELVEEPGNFYPAYGSTVSSTAPTVPANNEKAAGVEGGEGTPNEDTKSKLQKKYESSKETVSDKSKSLSDDYEQKLQSDSEKFAGAAATKALVTTESAINSSKAARFLKGLGNAFGFDPSNPVASAKGLGKLDKAAAGIISGNIYGATDDITVSLEKGVIGSLGPDTINNLKKVAGSSDVDLGNVFDQAK